MSAPRADDILFDSGGVWLTRYGVPFRRRMRGVSEPEAYTHTRADAATVATLLGRDGVLRNAAANRLRCTWDYSRTAPGLLLEGSHVNLVGYSENFGSWTDGGTPVATSGQADPFGGTAAYLLEDNDGAGVESKNLAVTFTADATKAFAIYLKAGTAAVTEFSLWDATAATHRHRVRATWTAGVPALTTVDGSGVLFPVEALAGGWYRCMANAAGVIAANTNHLFLYPAGSTAASTGTVYAFGAQAQNALYPGSYVKSNAGSTVTRAADACTFGIGFAPQDITVYAKLARPVWADATGTFGASRGILMIGGDGATQGASLYGLSSARSWGAWLGGQSVSASIPAGTTQEVCGQFRFATDGTCRLDVGSGFGAYSSAGTTTFANQTLRLGAFVVGDELDGAIERIVVACGSFTLSEMQAAPLP